MTKQSHISYIHVHALSLFLTHTHTHTHTQRCGYVSVDVVINM